MIEVWLEGRLRGIPVCLCWPEHVAMVALVENPVLSHARLGPLSSRPRLPVTPEAKKSRCGVVKKSRNEGRTHDIVDNKGSILGTHDVYENKQVRLDKPRCF